MKKLALVLTLALVLAFAAPVFANPFSDVPADHWAYEAINKLADDGVITGNPDGTYTGNKTMTRYELAVVVAKAMAAAEANADKVSAEDKATIDKLAAEFGGELKSLGVKVAALEKKVGNVKFTGVARVRYVDAEKKVSDPYVWATTGENKDRNKKLDTRLRLNANAYVNDNFSVFARFTTDNYVLSSSGVDNNGDATAKFDRFYVDYAKNGLDVKVGRQDIFLGKGLVIDDAIKGITVGAPVGKANLVVATGRLDTANGGTFADAAVLGDRIDFTAVQLSAPVAKKANIGFLHAVVKDKDKKIFQASSTVGDKKDNAAVTGLFFDYAINPKFTVFGEWAKTNVKESAVAAELGDNKLQNAYQFGIEAKEIMKKTDMTLTFAQYEKNAYYPLMLGTTLNDYTGIYSDVNYTADKVNLYEIKFNHNLMANTNLYLKYGHAEAKTLKNAGTALAGDPKVTLNRLETGIELTF